MRLEVLGAAGDGAVQLVQRKRSIEDALDLGARGDVLDRISQPVA